MTGYTGHTAWPGIWEDRMRTIGAMALELAHLGASPAMVFDITAEALQERIAADEAARLDEAAYRLATGRAVR